MKRAFMSALLDRVMGEGNLHPVEFQLYWSNLRANVNLRVSRALAR
jgi:hypothetical protein